MFRKFLKGACEASQWRELGISDWTDAEGYIIMIEDIAPAAVKFYDKGDAKHEKDLTHSFADLGACHAAFSGTDGVCCGDSDRDAGDSRRQH